MNSTRVVTFSLLLQLKSISWVLNSKGDSDKSFLQFISDYFPEYYTDLVDSRTERNTSAELKLALACHDQLTSSGKTMPPEAIKLESIFSRIQNEAPRIDFEPSILDRTSLPYFSKNKKGKSLLEQSGNFLKRDAEWVNQAKDENSFNHRLMSFIEKYCSSLPDINSDDYSIPISVKAHLAGAVAKSWAEMINDTDLTTLDPTSLNLRLICLDLSGIQNFIYAVTSEKALKGLRGRSVYLQLLMETIARYVAKKFNCSDLNILFNGGGNCYVLVADQDFDSTFSKIEKTINQILLAAHRGKLALVSASIVTKVTELTSDFSQLWQQLSLEIAKQKRKKFAPLLEQNEYRMELLGPFGEGGDIHLCEICGTETSLAGNCDFCKSFIDLATKVSHCDILAIKKRDSKIETFTSYKDVFRSLGFDIDIVKTPLPDATNFNLNSATFHQFTDGFRFFANNSPKKDNQVKTLEDFADGPHGIKRWGVLRADVDHLGQVFAGNASNKLTIEHVMTLSRALSFYFTAHVQSITLQEFKDDVYIIYSGGDDLFLIGHWNALPLIAKKIYRDFRTFSSNTLSLSAGIYIAPSEKFPTYQAAAVAGEALENAKNKGRNRLTIFDEIMPWESFEQVQKTFEQIVDLIENHKVARSALLSILGYAYAEQHKVKKGQAPLNKIWRVFYAFKQLQLRYKNQITDVNKLCNTFIENNQPREYLNVALRWAEFYTRNGGEK